jgi:hypothetical protein
MSPKAVLVKAVNEDIGEINISDDPQFGPPPEGFQLVKAPEGPAFVSSDGSVRAKNPVIE